MHVIVKCGNIATLICKFTQIWGWYTQTYMHLCIRSLYFHHHSSKTYIEQKDILKITGISWGFYLRNWIHLIVCLFYVVHANSLMNLFLGLGKQGQNNFNLLRQQSSLGFYIMSEVTWTHTSVICSIFIQ